MSLAGRLGGHVVSSESMTYFLSGQPLRVGESAELTGDEAHHAAGPRRMRPGEVFALQDPSGARFKVAYEGGGSKALRVSVLEELPVPPLPGRRVTLIQAAVKAKATDVILQKTTELGVARIVFFPSAHGTVALKELHHDMERGRWARIAWEACKQCDRQYPPGLHVAETMAAALDWAGPADRHWVCHPDSGAASPASAADPSSRILVGPEGGFTPEELRAAWDAGFEGVSLGPLVLRADTAAIAACSLALFG